MKQCTFTTEELTHPGGAVTGDGCVRITFRTERGGMLAGVSVDGLVLPPGESVREVPAGFPDARITQVFRVVVPPGGGISCIVTKTFIS